MKITLEHLPLKSLRLLLLASAFNIFLVILLGGIVRLAGAGGACPDWPTCFGGFTPPVGDLPALDYLHRISVALALPLLLLSSIAASGRLPSQPLISRSLWVAVGIMLVQIGIGAAFTNGISTAYYGVLGVLHLALSLIIQSLTAAAAVSALFIEARPPEWHQRIRISFRSKFSRFSLVSAAFVLLLMLSGAWLSNLEQPPACTNWPLCGFSLNLQSWQGWAVLAHQLIVAASSIVLSWLFIQAWRTQRTQTFILASTTAATALFFAQALMGSQLVEPPALHQLVLHQATAAAVWIAITVQVTAVGLAQRRTQDELREASEIPAERRLVRDLFSTTKPIVVALLLVTTYAGMVIAKGEWPSLAIAFWTLLAGFMAAGGSGSMNQYIDREDDLKMQRTQKRPLPAGKLTPAEVLSFGIALIVASFYILAAFINLLAALLSLAGAVYYVLIYSIYLKKTTVQNIVIGGGAGAIPPLVGWAAVTGSLNIPSLMLFAVIFLWTPPHFWALALVRRKDYARAGVPMLPVVRGEKETAWQILVYTLELVAVTLLLPLFGLGGSIYLVGASLLGLWLLFTAWKVWRQGGNKPAWKMYRYSSMYLAFLFAALVVDALV